jgi:ATP-binding cassette, subfamily B, bacterial MsbA
MSNQPASSPEANRPAAPTAPSAPRLMAALRRLRPYSANSRAYVVLIVVSVIVTALTEPLVPALLKALLDKGFNGQKLALWIAPTALIALFAVRGLSTFLAKFGTGSLAFGIAERLSAAQFSVLHTAHPQLYTQQTASSLVNTMVYEVQTGATIVVQALLTLSKNLLSIVALLAYLLYLNWQLTLIVFLVVPPIAWVIRTISKRLHQLVKKSQGATDELAYVVEENVLAWRAVRLHQAQHDQQKRFAQLARNLRKLAVKSTIASAAVMPLTQILAAIALSAVITVALVQNTASATSVGDFVAFMTAMLLLITPLRTLSEIAGQLTRGLTALERGLDLIERTPNENSGSYRPPVSAGASVPPLQFEHVSLRYPSAEQFALQDIDLTVAPGRTVALVGSSGSGKSSLVNLLPRFLEATQGRVLLGGVDVCEWDIAALRAQFAFVSQDVVMFSDSVGANVALGSTLDEAKLKAALQAAHLGDWLASLPQGLHTPVGHNASSLSGGQRQRLAIARALYKDAPIIVLDEATSALDTQSEQAVKAALAELTRGRTTLIIAHRLSTIEHADEIVVMHEGRVVERGSHAQLLALGGHYANLHQLGQSTGSTPS